MELNFDKEIDAILRKARESESAFVTDNLQTRHLDADEISAFAENALPEMAKQYYTAHLADCDLCRKKLSSLILLNAEAESEIVHAEEIVPISSAIPWYRKLFAFPNLAYTMGALVLVFSGIIGFTILQNVNNSQVSEVSKAIERPTDTKEKASDNAVASPQVSPEIAANAASNTNAASNYSLNSTTSNSAAMNSNMSMPATKPIATPIGTPQVETPREDDLVSAKDQKEKSPESVIVGSVSEESREVKKESERGKQPATSAETSDAVKSAPPPKVADLPVNGRNTTKLSAKRKQDSDSNSETTNIGGKTFKRQDNVWYDAAYNGQSTTNITRGTNEYKKLDKDLRVIVENLGGTIVVVWKEKAYRIR